MLLLSSPAAPLSAAVLLSLSLQVTAAPQASPLARQTIPLKKRSPQPQTEEEWGVWAKAHREGLEAKYGNSKHAKRGTGLDLCVFLLGQEISN